MKQLSGDGFKKKVIKEHPRDRVLKIIEAYIMQRAERASDSSPIH